MKINKKQIFACLTSIILISSLLTLNLLDDSKLIPQTFTYEARRQHNNPFITFAVKPVITQDGSPVIANHTGSVSTLSGSITIGNFSKMALFVMIGWGANVTISNIKIGSTNFTQGPHLYNSTNVVSEDIWYLSQTAGLPINQSVTVTVTFSSNASYPQMTLLSLYNVDQTNVINSSQNATHSVTTGTSDSLSVTPLVNGSWCLYGFTTNQTLTSQSGGTSLLTDTSGTYYGEAATKISNPSIGSGNSVTYNWNTGGGSTIAGCEVLQA